jgi:hypothetical protein
MKVVNQPPLREHASKCRSTLVNSKQHGAQGRGMVWHGVDEVLVRAQGAGPDQTSLCPFHTGGFAMPSYILDKATARGLVDKITASLDEIRDAIIQLWDGKGWVTLGYPSWQDLCEAEFRMKLQLPTTERISVVHDLTKRGMSSRAIGSALGVDQKTVVNDRHAGEEDSSPGTTIGLDGKRYHIPPPPEPRNIHPNISIDPPREPTPVPPPNFRVDPVGHMGTIDRVAGELLLLLGRADARHDPAKRRVLLGDLAAAIEARREHWVE